jgi:hypothetical protein
MNKQETKTNEKTVAVTSGSEVTEQQIEQWKKQHGDVYLIEVDGRKAYLRPADRKTISYATAVGAKDPMAFNEALIQNCWLGGDEEIKTVDALFMGASAVLHELIEVKTASIKKL